MPTETEEHDKLHCSIKKHKHDTLLEIEYECETTEFYPMAEERSFADTITR